MSTVYTMNSDLDVVADAVDDDVCRHCGNARNDGTPAPDLCTECGRCYGLNKCQCAPTCVVRDMDGYAGDEDQARVTPPIVNVNAITPGLDSEFSTPFPVNSTLALALSKDVNPATVTTASVFLVDADGDPIGPAASSNPTVSGGHTITLHLSANLAYSTAYRFRVTKDVLDVDGMCLVEEFTSEPFTTRSSDAIAPTVVSVTPANGATGVAAGVNVVVTFSEAMHAPSLALEGVPTGAIYLNPEDGGSGGEVEAISMSVGNTVATCQVSVRQAGKRYTVHVTTDAKDANGNPIAVAYAQATGHTVAP